MTRVIVLSVLILSTVGMACKKVKPPTAKFTYLIDKGGVVYFTNTSHGQIDELVWDFDDGDSSNEASPTHRFLKAGTYDVALLLKNEGGSDSKIERITVEDGEKINIESHPLFQDGYGFAYARNTYEYESQSEEYTNLYGSAVAAFYDTTDFLVGLGVVTCTGNTLTRNGDNTYSYASPDSSFYFTDEDENFPNWRIDGNGDSYPTIVFQNKKPFPIISKLVAKSTMHLDTNYYVSSFAGPAYNADSVSYLIQDYDGVVMAKATVRSGINGYDFKSKELDGVVPGDAVLVMIAYNTQDRIYNNKKVYFINESYTEMPITVER